MKLNYPNIMKWNSQIKENQNHRNMLLPQNPPQVYSPPQNTPRVFPPPQNPLIIIA